MKRNGLILSGVGVATVGAATYLLKDKSRRSKITESVKGVSDKCMSMFSKEKQDESGKEEEQASLTNTENDTNPSSETFPVEKSGHPDPEDVPDNKMVDEGSQYGVQYYNDKKE